MRTSLAALILLALAGCDSKKEKSDSALAKRPLQAGHRAMLVRFADAVVKKDYRAAYEETSADYRKDVGWEEFETSIRRYREGAEAAPTYVLGASEEDPKEWREGLIELFVPEAMRSKVVEEAVLHFTVKGKTPDDEGFWSVVCWIVEEGGAPKILNYVQDD